MICFWNPQLWAAWGSLGLQGLHSFSLGYQMPFQVWASIGPAPVIVSRQGLAPPPTRPFSLGTSCSSCAAGLGAGTAPQRKWPPRTTYLEVSAMHAAFLAMQELQIAGVNFKAFDLGGHEIARKVWKDYYAKVSSQQCSAALPLQECCAERALQECSASALGAGWQPGCQGSCYAGCQSSCSVTSRPRPSGVVPLEPLSSSSPLG